MAPPKSTSSRHPPRNIQIREGNKSDKKNNGPPPRRKPQEQHQQQRQKTNSDTENQDANQIDISAAVPIPLQQLLLNVFKAALLPSTTAGSQDPDAEASLDTKSLIQTIKSHLYNRDFDSAFADADDKLLRAYALRWSAARALGYAGLFKSLLKVLVDDYASNSGEGSAFPPTHAVCIGGGAGAEIVALAVAWRDLIDEGTIPGPQRGLSDTLESVSLDDSPGHGDESASNTSNRKQAAQQSAGGLSSPSLSITAVDIADWSAVVNRLSSTVLSPTIRSSESHPAPLLPLSDHQQQHTNADSSMFNVDFKRLDVLTLPDSDLTSLFHPTKSSPSHTTIVTLMFTLNELFSTSMPKATAFLLRTTDLLERGTILLVVDSPGSYSTLKLGKGTNTGTQERQYPMKFLLDHTLLSVAKGKWERVFSQDSRWWRRDEARLRYHVGEGAGLEDMRFQIHVYRRV